MTEAPEAEPLPPVPPAVDEPAEFIDRPGKLRAFCDRLADCDEVALDTEANSMHAYQEQTCIVQLTAGGRNAILDVLALETLEPLRDALDRPDVTVVMHGGDYDITCLTRDHDFRFHRVFDTMIAATLLDAERVGLAHLVEAAYGDVLDKRYQRADWARRPLSPEQLDYLRRDTLYLPGLRAHWQHQLEVADLVEEAEIEFRRLAQRQGVVREEDPDAWRRIKGAGRLNAVGRCVLLALHEWREGIARSRNVPPFKVFAPKTMLALAAKPPSKAQHPRQLPFLSHGERARHGRALLAAIQRGLENHAAGRIPPARLTPALSAEETRVQHEQRKRQDALKAWRRVERERRKVPGLVILPNPAIAWMVERVPSTLEELAACPDIGSKRLARDGEAILAVLRKEAGDSSTASGAEPDAGAAADA
jgi:ribonuclease D